MRKRSMKIKSENPIIEIVDEDDDFLSLVAAAEAQALANKRRRITPSIPATDSKDNSDAEGIYLAALKGNDNLLQQSIGKVANARVKVVSSGNDNVYGGGGLGNACFKCSKLGHWSRDCGAEVGGGGDGDGGYNGNSYSSDQSIPEKSCPCGSGNCVVLTANTEKNRGRKFYKCPIRQENGGCGFFEWCDVSTGASVDAGGTQNYASNASYSDVPCPCGAGLCLILTAKTGNNIGRQFFRCPAHQGSSCGFFKWCNELSTPGPGGIPATASKVTYNVSDPNNKVVRNGSSCFKCGKEGHWAKDCSIPTLNSPAQVGGRSSLSSSCFKCGKEGHWAKDCSIPTLNSPAQVGGRSSLSSAGYKCGKPGHWAKDCSF